jgi:ABC-type antimicrobial peptide transport system permease subunit
LAAPEHIAPALKAIADLLVRRHRVPEDRKHDTFDVRDNTQLQHTLASTTQTFGILLGAVAAISLVVGGIGIMNIMLVSVTERTREIGLRMAVGARSGDILMQVRVEAVTLSLIGGLIGIALGVGGAMLIAELAEWRTELSLASILLAVGFAASVGIFFGYYPARKASRLSPIEALRYE